MKAFRRETGVVAPLLRANVDTDQIIPKQFLKRIERTGYGPFLFFDWRYRDGGEEIADFVLNRAPYREATFLVAGRNFGCGSSREHAVWALSDFGIRAVVAPSFADIFRSNALKEGLLPVALDEEAVTALAALAEGTPGTEMTVDLEARTVTAGVHTWGFEMADVERHRVLEGLDDIGIALQHAAAIDAFEARRPSWMPDLGRLTAEEARA